MNFSIDDFLSQAQVVLDSFPYEDCSEFEGSARKEALPAAFYFRWLLERGRASSEIQNDWEKIEADSISSIDVFYSLAKGILCGDVMTGDANIFTRHYYRPGWKYLYYDDLDSLFHDFDDFSEVEDGLINREKVFAVLDSRFDEWRSSSSQAPLLHKSVDG